MSSARRSISALWIPVKRDHEGERAKVPGARTICPEFLKLALFRKLANDLGNYLNMSALTLLNKFIAGSLVNRDEAY